ncbi:ATP-binding protein [Bradyrhizobium sp. TZ2]
MQNIVISFTVENSNIGILRFEVSAALQLGEGQVVFVRLNGTDVFYQILDAQTAEESFDQNPRGTHIVNAVQLGCYSPENGFTKYGWLSTMNTPVFWAKARVFPPAVLKPGEFVIGSVPSTNIRVAANIDDLVQFHTAVLGVTGTGKTELALDIVREAVKNDFRVFCVDFTGEYKARLKDLSPIFPAPTAAQIDDLDQKTVRGGDRNIRCRRGKGRLEGLLATIKDGVETQIKTFLEGGEKLAILELTEISNTKATLRITEQYLSTIMAWARKHRQARKVLIVLEEAHTIIPETFSSGFDGDTQWVVSRIGQIALQGRKYGVGLLVVSQRTALVSKTILSQCNTFLTHSLIDQTSLTFLESVYSSQHVRSIPNLGRFEFLAAGKAIKAERPILLGRPFDQAKKDASDALRQPPPAPSDGAQAGQDIFS